MQNSVAKKIFAVGSAVAMSVAAFAPLAALATVHANGQNVSDSSGTVYMVIGGQRRPYTSAGAFTSYGFNSFASVVSASAEDLALPVGSFIPPQDGSIVCSDRGADKGTCYEISNGQKFGFTSAAVFTGLGFSFANSVSGDVSWMSSGSTLINNTTSAHLSGTLVNNGGTVQLVGNGSLLGVPDLATFNSWGYSFSKVVPANSADKVMTQSGVFSARTAGMLSPSWTTNPGCTVNCPPVNVGPFNVSVASDTPAPSTLVAGQSVADLAHFVFTGNGSITNLQLKRIGVSSDTTLNNVYLFDGATRLTDNASANTSGVINFNNANGLFTVNGSRTISVKADVNSGTNGQTVGVQVMSYTVSGSSVPVTVSGVQGNIMSIATVSNLASVNLGTNTVSAATINAGTLGYIAWSAPVSVSGRNAWLKSVTYKYIGSAPLDALQNIKLYVDGTPVGNSATVNANNYIVFDLTGAPLSLSTGSHTVDVRVDVIKGSFRTFQLQVQNAGDFFATDSQLGVGTVVSSPSAGSFSTNSAGVITIATGSITVTLDPTFTQLTTVTGGGTNTVIGKFKVQAYGEDVKVQTLSVTPSIPTSTPTAAGLNNVQLYYNGAQVGSSQNWTTGALTFNLGSSMIVQAGVVGALEVRADIQTSGFVNYTLGTVIVTLNIGSSNGQGQNSLNTSNVPAAAISTTGLSISTGTLSFSKNPAYANQTVAPNTPNSKIASFSLQNTSSSEAVRVTNLAVSLGFVTQTYTNFSNLKTSEASGSGATPIAPASGSPSINNFSVNFTLAPGETRTIDILADVSSVSGGTVIVTMTPTAIGQSSNVNVSPTATAGQTITVAAGSVNAPTLVSSGSLVAQYLIGGAQNVPLATFNFVATSGVSSISELKFTVSGTGVSPIASVTVAGKTAPVVGGVAYLTGLGITVPNTVSGLNQLVTVNLSPVGNNGEAGGVAPVLTLTYVKYTSGGTTAVLTPSVAANTVTLVGSLPTIVVKNLDGSSGTPSINIGSNIALADITISADPAGDIKLTQLPVSISANGGNGGALAITASTVTITEVNGATISGIAAPAHAAISNGTNGTANIVFSTPYTISAGTSASITVKMDPTKSNFTWTDVNGSYAATGTLIYSYPTAQLGKIGN
jgi:hypothetical protein